METLLNRYRNITVLLVVIFAQLVLLAWQVKNRQDVRLIRVWAVTAVSPMAKVLETVRGGTTGFVGNYIMIHDAREENKRLQAEVSRLKMENHYLQAELSTADRAQALTAFQRRTPSKTLAAQVIMTGAGTNSKVLFVDRGSTAGVMKDMPVVTPDGIVGKVIAAYPTASQIMLITDPDFAAGVVSQKNHVHGTLKGQGYALCKVDYVPNEEKVDVGEMFYTSGDDRIFPRGFPVGIVKVVRGGNSAKEILLEPSGMQRGVEQVLILVEGVHQMIPDFREATPGPVYMSPPPPADTKPVQTQLGPDGKPAVRTEADRLREKYQAIGDAQGHKFGEGTLGTRPPDFNIKVQPGQTPPVKPPTPAAGAPPAGTPAPAPAPRPAGTPPPQ